MTEAKIKLQHNQFQVIGPPDLVLWIQSLGRLSADGPVIHAAFMKRLEKYYVPCSITGDPVVLSELRYWNVERQESYKNAAVGLARYEEILALP